MHRKYYKSYLTGKIIGEPRISVVNDIYGKHTVEILVRTGLLKPYEPSIIDLLRHSNRLEAIIFCRDIHHTTLVEAQDMVTLIEKDMKRFANH